VSAQTYKPTFEEVVANMLARCDEGAREFYEERAGVIAETCGIPVIHAEYQALLETLIRWPEIFTGVQALEVEIDGATQWILTTDPAFARRHLADIGATEIGSRNPADVVVEQFGHVALLCTLG
jgi:hypothetical protein